MLLFNRPRLWAACCAPVWACCIKGLLCDRSPVRFPATSAEPAVLGADWVTGVELVTGVTGAALAAGVAAVLGNPVAGSMTWLADVDLLEEVLESAAPTAGVVDVAPATAAVVGNPVAGSIVYPPFMGFISNGVGLGVGMAGAGLIAGACAAALVAVRVLARRSGTPAGASTGAPAPRRA